MPVEAQAIKKEQIAKNFLLKLAPGEQRELSEELKAMLFGDRPRIFAVLDSACLPELLPLIEADQLSSLCLFKGALAIEAAEVAPWLVELTHDCRLLRRLLTDDGSNGAGVLGSLRAQAGILLQGNLSLAGLQRHLRRFMRVKNSQGATYFFRFWEPQTAAIYFHGLADRPGTVTRWFHALEGGSLESVWCPIINKENEGELVHLRLGDLPEGVRRDTGAFTLSNSDVRAFTTLRWQRDCQDIAARLRKSFAETTQKFPEQMLEETCSVTMHRMAAFGLSQLDALFTCCAWDIHYGPNFENRDPDGEIGHLLRGSLAAEHRFAKISARMEALEQSRVFD